MIDKNRVFRVLQLAGLVGLLAACGPSFAAESDAAGDEIEVVPVRGGVYMLVGGGVNATLQIGDDGVLLVDTMQEDMAEHLLAAVRKLSDKPIRYVLNTSGNPDQVGGNPVIAAAGSTINAGNVAGAIADSTVGAAVVAHENVLTRMSVQDPPPPFEGWPTSTYFFTPTKDVFFNGEAIQLIYQPDAVTNGDSFVYFRRSDVISAGSIFDFTRYPFIDVDNGGTFAGTLESLNNLIDLTVPEDKQEGGTMVIPARGRLCDESEVVEYRDMLTIIGNYIREMIDEGRSLEQVLEARPTLAYDPRYGADSGSWTTDMFVETVYREFTANGSSEQ
ncbi:MBL fold metallo-hydrolase [Elongatibacter sediminis]|uniref:MBL fold metallo-hydrolase n=1 Tax=Elongatibacter sediminis TaxID=3119006 RepID=A0AAW9R578_9GAMM